MKTIKTITATSILALTPASLLPLPTHPAHADTINAGDKYVALGDSYASTGTLAQQVPGTHPACVQDQDNYPHQLAQKLNLNLDDASCAWALTYQYDQPQNHALPGTAPTPQKEHLTEDTKLITISLGGNDAGLADVFAQCAPTSTYPDYPTAKTQQNRQPPHKSTTPTQKAEPSTNASSTSPTTLDNAHHTQR
ncbi:GDSL-type esterase/lipase family protein [Corynebacterium pseudokroppenstedtii]|uniref:GDSL-type esterase/lipase family protein n=1 Tax=Corynebacterium pseudokroppenstedtii TaxID=2804917 RepID=A0AAU0Q0R9_9CORY|nr:GDSL-type esterase/lipase family protein [Corynebacterium pseudokroppenstedtii]